MSKRGWWVPKPISRIQVEPDIEILRQGVHPDTCKVGVPEIIWQTWETYELQPRMKAAISALKAANPAFAHHLVDNAERRAFLVENFSDVVVSAYDTLIPGAFRADLWRYCVLYLRGGYYVDVKFAPVNGWSLSSLKEPLYVLDHCYSLGGPIHGIYNAFLMAKPGCTYMKAAIEGIVRNVQKRVIGDEMLCITGPGLLGGILSSEVCTLYWDKKRIVTRDVHTPLLAQYEGYREDCVASGIVHYSTLWPRSIYREHVSSVV